jgi:hypothetical protein
MAQKHTLNKNINVMTLSIEVIPNQRDIKHILRSAK